MKSFLSIETYKKVIRNIKKIDFKVSTPSLIVINLTICYIMAENHIIRGPICPIPNQQV